MLREILAGLEEEGCQGRVVRISHSIDLGVIGLSAARLSGSGIGIGLQAKGTVLIHRRDLNALANLERAAELSALSDEDLLMMYETLRPGRSSGEELRLLSERL